MLKTYSSSILKKYSVSIIAVLIIYLAYLICACFATYTYIPNYQWVFFFGELIFSVWVYFILNEKTKIKLTRKGKIIIILFTYIIVTWVEFSPTVFNLFRSDYWLFATLFYDSQQNISLEVLNKIALFELFGHPRFMPFANLTMFLRYLILGNNVFSYHVLNLILHVTVSFLIFLLLYEFIRNILFSYIFGLLFIVVPSQFDMIVWEYHVFLLLSTSIILCAILLAYKYSKGGNVKLLFASFILIFLSLFFYEPHVFAPAIVVLIIMIKYASRSWDNLKQRILLSKKEVFLTIGLVVFIYIIFFIIFKYVMIITKEKHVQSFHDIFSLKNMLRGMGAVFVNLWESTFLNNIGIIPRVEITDIVYVNLSGKTIYYFVNIINFIIGLFLVSLFRFNQKNRYITSLLIVFTISYLFLISVGRLLSSPGVSYITSQPRYQYFPNAMFLIISGVLLYNKFKQSKFKVIITTILISIFFWNALTVLDANNKIAKAMKPIDSHYYKIKNFVASHPSAMVFLNFVPSNYDPTWGEAASKFFLGSDIALDILFKNKITNFLEKATHIYDGNSFMENTLYKKDNISPYLKDFTIEWMYWYPPEVPPRKKVVFIGSDKVRPKISLTSDDFIEIDMEDSDTREVGLYKIKHPYKENHHNSQFNGRVPGSWASMVLEKNGDAIYLIFNGILTDKVKLKPVKYNQWNADGIDLLGSYYRGIGESVFVSSIFKQLDIAKYGCATHSIGEKIAVDIKIPH